MKVGDLVRNLNSEGGLLGVIINFHENGARHVPVVCWQDGRTGWITRSKIKIIKES